MKKQCIILFLIATWSTGAVCIDTLSQDLLVKNELIKINQAYSQFDKLSMKFSYLSVYNRNGQQTEETLTGMVIQDQKEIYQKIGGVEIMTSNHYKIIVNHDYKNVVISRIKQATQAKAIDPSQIARQMEQLFSLCKKTNIEVLNKKVKKIVFDLPESIGYKRITITYRKDDYVITEMEMWTSEQMRAVQVEAPNKLTIRISDIRVNQPVDRKVFSLEHYVLMTPEGYVGSDIYKNYEVNSQI